ncbi:acyl-CoA carboxylase epsilon subunit [Streptomyces sp. NPDC017890]|uniref:acyl-CoA carboxylase epsilon subunit n=1 Tax=Streptomyces sp. NPDC017890 TaxID=3365015 RepID=UPI0037938FBA
MTPRTTTSTPSPTAARTALAPFPLPPAVAVADASAAEQLPKPLLVFRGDPTPDEVAAVTAAILAVLPRRAPTPPVPARARARRARWTPSEVPTASWQRAS